MKQLLLLCAPSPLTEAMALSRKRDFVFKSRIKRALYSLLLAFALFAVAILLTGRNPLSVYQAILVGSFGSVKGFLSVLAYMLPLVLTGGGASVAFQSGVMNIGGEGQLVVGGMVAVIVGLINPLPAPFGYIVSLAAGALAGAFWALLPTFFAGRNLASLSVATIMMNSIAALLTEYIVKHFFQREGASNTETVVVNEGSILPRFFPSTQFNYGVFLAAACVIAVTWMLYRTAFGFSLRAMGRNPSAMRQAGVPIYRRTLAAMAVSGSLFALGGSIQCLAVYKRFVMGFSPGYGWDGITVATLAGNHPVGVLLSAFLFGMLRSASVSMNLADSVTPEMITMLQGLIIILVASPSLWTVFRNMTIHAGAGKQEEGGGHNGLD